MNYYYVKKEDIIFMIHYTTNNTNFLQQFAYLAELGYKTNILELHNPELVNIDPYDADLPEFTKKAIIEECKNNIWYFIREVIKTYDYGTIARQAKVNLAVIEMINLLKQNEHQSIWSTTPRQQYGTLTTYIMAIHRLLVDPGVKIGTISLHKSPRPMQNIIKCPEFLSIDYTDRMYHFKSDLYHNLNGNYILNTIQKYHITHLIIDDIEFIAGIGNFLSMWYKRLKDGEDMPVIYTNCVVTDRAKETGAYDILRNPDIVSAYISGEGDWIYDRDFKEVPIVNITTFIDTIDLSGKTRKRLRTFFGENRSEIYEKEVLLKR